MRKIKFRQFVNGKWHYWGFVSGGFIAPAKSKTDKYPSYQFTGLKDKNGTDIYEGDIVLLSSFHVIDANNRKPHMRIIGWQDDRPSMTFLTADCRSASGAILCQGNADRDIFEVIGNIHENPELLEE